MRRMGNRLLALALIVAATAACVRNQPDVIVITATFSAGPLEVADAPPGASPMPPIQQTFYPDLPLSNPTADPTRALAPIATGRDYIVQPGDSLSKIANDNGVGLDILLEFNNITNPDLLEVGQVIRLPDPPSEYGPDFKILPDSRLVLGPGSSSFDVNAFISQQPGYIRTAIDEVDDQVLTGAQIVSRISREYSVDARILLALLEYQSAWLSNPAPSDAQKIYPMGVQGETFGFDRQGLYRQLAWTANQLNWGYYSWKERSLATLELPDNARLLYAPGLNAGTAAVQHTLSLLHPYSAWRQASESDGLYRVYAAYFGNPFDGAVEPLVPPGLEQPPLTFPFPAGETWYFTGGPHGGWGAGSAWAAVDFAPPDDLTTKTTACYVSDFFATAPAPGVIARIDTGIVILDLDGDGDETTGWTILYLHVAQQDRVQRGTRVQVGDRIGRPSCEGGVTNGTHIHFARRYNGEWIPAACDSCSVGSERPSFVFDGWTVFGLPNQEYQGYMMKGGDQRIAEQGRNVVENRVSWTAS